MEEKKTLVEIEDMVMEEVNEEEKKKSRILQQWESEDGLAMITMLCRGGLSMENIAKRMSNSAIIREKDKKENKKWETQNINL